MIDSAHLYLGLSAVMFSLGAVGVCSRRNPVTMFMCIELMLNSANLALAVFARCGSFMIHEKDIQVGVPISQALNSQAMGGPADGLMFIFLVMTIAAAEAVVGLAIIIAIFRSRSVIDVDDLASLKG